MHVRCVVRRDVIGHVSGVTDARFSGLGDRILTASMEDGTARIYSWGPRFSNVKHVVLKVSYGFSTATKDLLEQFE